MNRAITFFLLITASLMATSAGAANLYRYVNNEGITVLDRTIPPQFVPQGYSILNERGEVLKVVPRALTEEEKSVMRVAQQKLAEQAARDAELKRLYRTPDDVDQAMIAWVNRLNVEMSLANGHLTAKKGELAHLQSNAADVERAGNSVTPELMEQIHKVQNEIESSKLNIALISKRIDADIQMFELDKIRVVELTGILAKSTISVLQEREMRVPDFLLAK